MFSAGIETASSQSDSPQPFSYPFSPSQLPSASCITHLLSHASSVWGLSFTIFQQKLKLSLHRAVQLGNTLLLVLWQPVLLQNGHSDHQFISQWSLSILVGKQPSPTSALEGALSSRMQSGLKFHAYYKPSAISTQQSYLQHQYLPSFPWVSFFSLPPPQHCFPSTASSLRRDPALFFFLVCHSLQRICPPPVNSLPFLQHASQEIPDSFSSHLVFCCHCHFVCVYTSVREKSSDMAWIWH